MSSERFALHHLVFSTRAAEPRSGTEFNREVIAASPGAPEAARQELARLGDMTGAVLRRPELPPLWAFRRLDEERWLVVRAVSLGLYRKGHHQLLVDGVVLPREAVDALDGNPFLLATGEARAAGFRFGETHPGGPGELPLLALDPAFAATARRLNLDRLRHGSERFRELDPAFPALYESARDRSRPTAVAAGGAPDPALLEWLLLHFHPADRAELSFHTWYAYEQALPFDLLGVASEDVPELRGRLRDLDLWTPEARGSEDGLGARVLEVRRREPGLLPRTLEGYYLTLLAGGHRLDVRREPFHPVSPEEAEVCLRAALGEALTEEEEELRLRLSLRGDAGLYRHASELGALWRRGPDAFEAHLARLGAAADELRRLDLRRVPPVVKPEERLGLLALLGLLLEPEETEDAGGLHDLWRQVVPPEALPELLALLEGEARAAAGERVLGPWVLAVARVEATGGSGEPAAWPDYLRRLHRAGRAVAPAAGRIERVLEGAPAEAALAGYRRLQKVCFETGLDAFAVRLLLQREVPRLPAAAARIRLGDGVRALLRGDGAADAFLGEHLADPDAAAVVLGALAGQLAAGAGAGREAPPEPPPDTWPDTWARCRRLLEAQRRPALPRAAAGAAGAFVARLALSPLAERTAEALDLVAGLGPTDGPVGDRGRFRHDVLAQAAASLAHLLPGPAAAVPAASLGTGLAGLLAARLDPRAPGEPDEAVDRDLLGALAPALVLVGPGAEGGAELRGHLDRYLDRLLDGDRLARVADPRGPWRHLLLDELLAAPPRDPGDDPRYRAYLQLAWHRWSAAAGTTGEGAAEVALLRLVLSPGPAPDPGLPWHQALARRTLPSHLHPAADALLAHPV